MGLSEGFGLRSGPEAYENLHTFLLGRPGQSVLAAIRFTF